MKKIAPFLIFFLAIIPQAIGQPNDPAFEKSWGLNNSGQEIEEVKGKKGVHINALKSWEITTGSAETIIAVIDSGVAYDHPDLKNNIWINSREIPANGIDDDQNGFIDDYYGWDFVDNDNDPMDYNGHGTLVAGIIAAEGNNGIGTTGVMWKAKIMVLRFLNSTGAGDTVNVIKAIDYAIKNGARIINASWGGYDFNHPLEEAIEQARQKGVLIITAAGNDNTDIDFKEEYPSGFQMENIIVVTATDNQDNLPFFSNYGLNKVDISAPGENIFNTLPSRELIYQEEKLFLSEGEIISPEFNLTQKKGCNISFQINLKLKKNDFLLIEASEDEVHWEKINHDDYIGELKDFRTEDLGGFNGKSKVFYRFRIVKENSDNLDLVAINNLEVTCHSIEYIGEEYGFESGTSFSAPFVSGAAGLLFSKFPQAEINQIKTRLLCSGDNLPSLKDKVLTQSRLNVYKALTGSCGRIKFSNEQGMGEVILSISGDDEKLLTTKRDGYYYLDLTQGNYILTPQKEGYIFFPENISVNIPAGINNNFDFIGKAKIESPTLQKDRCFIATAAFGTSLASEVVILKKFRDHYLLNNFFGGKIVSLYYKTSPPLADFISRHEFLKKITRLALLPIIFIARFLG